MFSKPCRRPTCPVLITARGPKGLAKRIYCSRSCSALERVAAGWQPHAHLTPEHYIKAGQRGGKIAGENRRKRKVLETVRRLTTLIPAAMQEALGRQELRRVQVLLQRAHDEGYTRGYRASWAAQQSQIKAKDRTRTQAA